MSKDTRRKDAGDDEAKREARLAIVGRRVADARERRGLSQKQLATQIDRAVNSVSRWETGVQEMGILDALAIAAALELPVQDLLDPRPPVGVLRDTPMFFVSPDRIAKLRAARSNEDMLALLGTSPQIGVAIDPSDVQVSESQWEAAVREANDLLRRRASGSLAQLLQQLRKPR